MELHGEATLTAPPARVWAVLRDREALRRLLPAARDLTPAGADTLEGSLVLGAPPLAQRFPVQVHVCLDPDGAGFRVAVRGTRHEDRRLEIRCRLRAGGGDASTAVGYTVQADLGTLGRFVRPAAAERMAADFLTALEGEAAGRS